MKEKKSLSISLSPTRKEFSVQAKVRIFSQRSKVLRYFSTHKGTMLDCAKATGIERANVCRYVADLVDKGKVKKLYQGRDKTTKSKAYYYCVAEEKK